MHLLKSRTIVGNMATYLSLYSGTKRIAPYRASLGGLLATRIHEGQPYVRRWLSALNIYILRGRCNDFTDGAAKMERGRWQLSASHLADVRHDGFTAVLTFRSGRDIRVSVCVTLAKLKERSCFHWDKDCERELSEPTTDYASHLYDGGVLVAVPVRTELGSIQQLAPFYSYRELSTPCCPTYLTEDGIAAFMQFGTNDSEICELQDLEKVYRNLAEFCSVRFFGRVKWVLTSPCTPETEGIHLSMPSYDGFRITRASVGIKRPRWLAGPSVGRVLYSLNGMVMRYEKMSDTVVRFEPVIHAVTFAMCANPTAVQNNVLERPVIYVSSAARRCSLHEALSLLNGDGLEIDICSLVMFEDGAVDTRCSCDQDGAYGQWIDVIYNRTEFIRSRSKIIRAFPAKFVLVDRGYRDGDDDTTGMQLLTTLAHHIKQRYPLDMEFTTATRKRIGLGGCLRRAFQRPPSPAEPVHMLAPEIPIRNVPPSPHGASDPITVSLAEGNRELSRARRERRILMQKKGEMHRRIAHSLDHGQSVAGIVSGADADVDCAAAGPAKLEASVAQLRDMQASVESCGSFAEYERAQSVGERVYTTLGGWILPPPRTAPPSPPWVTVSD